jgi:hypothetical protein
MPAIVCEVQVQRRGGVLNLGRLALPPRRLFEGTMTKPIAHLHYSPLTGRWVAYDANAKLICADLHKDVVARVCEELDYRVVEAKH